jgi:UDP-hydrolysing UDP-N-acetyl-D-glucosamine 2-epimerase
MTRKICIVTGTRAEYGLLYWLMKEVQQDPDLELQVVVTGMHLSPEFGLTYKLIEEDGFMISEKVEMILSSDSPVGITKSMGLASIGFADAFYRLQPHIVVMLGDRYEIHSAAQAAMMARLPIAHIHGGEITEGAIDEQIRHSLTKMSHIHFTASEEYRNRVIQMGEQPDRVLNYGAPGIDHILKQDLLTKEELGENLGVDFTKEVFLITFHPPTLEEGATKSQVKELLSALDEFPDAQLLFTKANSDAEGRVINELLEDYTDINKDRSKLFTSLGQKRYLSSLKYATLVLGNSSSGIIEAPVFKIPTINIGDRQKGRLKAISIIDCLPKKEEIINAIRLAQTNDFKCTLSNTKSVYGTGNTSVLIKDYLKKLDLTDIVKKRFYDIAIR